VCRCLEEARQLLETRQSLCVSVHEYRVIHILGHGAGPSVPPRCGVIMVFSRGVDENCTSKFVRKFSGACCHFHTCISRVEPFHGVGRHQEPSGVPVPKHLLRCDRLRSGERPLRAQWLSSVVPAEIAWCALLQSPVSVRPSGCVQGGCKAVLVVERVIVEGCAEEPARQVSWVASAFVLPQLQHR